MKKSKRPGHSTLAKKRRARKKTMSKLFGEAVREVYEGRQFVDFVSPSNALLLRLRAKP